MDSETWSVAPDSFDLSMVVCRREGTLYLLLLSLGMYLSLFTFCAPSLSLSLSLKHVLSNSCTRTMNREDDELHRSGSVTTTNDCILVDNHHSTRHNALNLGSKNIE